MSAVGAADLQSQRDWTGAQTATQQDEKIEQCGPDNPRPCGTFGPAPADSAARAGARPKASGGI